MGMTTKLFDELIEKLAKNLEEEMEERKKYKKFKVVDLLSGVGFSTHADTTRMPKNMNDAANQMIHACLSDGMTNGTVKDAINYVLENDRNLIDFLKFVADHMEARHVR